MEPETEIALKGREQGREAAAVIPVTAALVIVAVWLTVALADVVLQTKKKEWMMRYRLGKTKNEPYLNNFLLRFFYELFLEICICSLINIGLADMDHTSPGF